MTTDNFKGKGMSQEDFADLLDRNGTDLARWPADLQGPARALLAESEEARVLLRDAETLDALLDEAPAGEVHAALTARILATAPGSQAAADPQDAAAAQGGLLRRLIGSVWPELGWLRPAALMALSLVAGLYVGLAGPQLTTDTQQTDLFAYVFDSSGTWDTTGDVE